MKNNLNLSELKREIGLTTASAVVVANMVGTGIFTTSGFIIEELANPTAMLLCWCIGGLFALCGALCYGELGARYPEAGGEYVYLREAFGKYKDRLVFLDFITDQSENVYPMIMTGQGHNEMYLSSAKGLA